MVLREQFSDETGNDIIVVSPDARGLSQSIKAPTSATTQNMGGSIQFEVTDEPGTQGYKGGSFLHDIKIAYRFQNTAVAPATDSFLIPVSGIWTFIRECKIVVDGVSIIHITRPGQLRDMYLSNVNREEDVQRFLNKNIGTANLATLTDLLSTRTVGVGATSPLYVSSFREVFGNLFRNRHLSFFRNINIEMKLIVPGTDYENTRHLGYTAGSNLNNLRLTGISTVVEYVNQGVVKLQHPRTSYVPIQWFDYRTSDHVVTAQTAGTLVVPLDPDFPQRSSVTKLWFYVTNSALGGAITVGNNMNQYINNGWLTSLELQLNGNRVWFKDGIDCFKMMLDHIRRNGNRVRDTPFNSTSCQTACPWLFVSFERDFVDLQIYGVSHSVYKSTGIENSRENKWTVHIGYDLTGLAAQYDRMVTIMESSRIVCLHSNGSSPRLLS